MITHKQDRNLEVNEPSNIVYDYPLPIKNIGISYQELNGRIPQKGGSKNTICTECYYILEGNVEVWIDGVKLTAVSGDVVTIKPGCQSYLIAKDLKMITITSPDWYVEQHIQTE